MVTASPISRISSLKQARTYLSEWAIHCCAKLIDLTSWKTRFRFPNREGSARLIGSRISQPRLLQERPSPFESAMNAANFALRA